MFSTFILDAPYDKGTVFSVLCHSVKMRPNKRETCRIFNQCRKITFMSEKLFFRIGFGRKSISALITLDPSELPNVMSE